MNRRQFSRRLMWAGAAALTSSRWLAAAEDSFRFRYIVGSSLFGEMPLREILPQLARVDARWIDIWPRVHGNQREQMEAMGHEAFAELLREHGVQLGCLTRYDLGPFALSDELKIAGKLGCPLVVCGGKGPTKLQGSELKAAVKTFSEQMKPHLEAAAQEKVCIALENHGNNLIDSPDSLRWLVEFCPAPHLGVALAPYHLEALGLGAEDMAQLIEDLGSRLVMFYAWQHGMGCVKKLPKEQEMLQMPGRGSLDFKPLIRALRKIKYQGFTEIFMHPVPRGIPILPTANEVGDAINQSRHYLETCRNSL